MNEIMELPAYADEALAGLSPVELIDVVIENEDRVPRNLIDECARRGDEMTDHLSMLHRDDFLWDTESGDGVWWLMQHAAMILGLIPSENAGLLLVELMGRMPQEGDDDMQDWLSGCWPVLFKNKPESVLPALRELGEDRDMDSYMRANAIETVVAAASWRGGETLEQELAWVAKIAEDEDEDFETCLTAGSMLLHFPRPQYRKLLEDLALLQDGLVVYFDMQSIEMAYAGKYYAPEWERFTNPWEFYEPDAISKRQIRWREEDELEVQRALNGGGDYAGNFCDPYFIEKPYVRPEPKVGRNDPCPCGSGKKYKKCCLENA